MNLGSIMSKVSKLLFSCVLLGSTIGTVQAETQYVTENLNTYLRRGAGDQFKIAGAIQSGEAVTVLEQQGNTQPSFVSFKPTVLFNTQCISSKGRKNKRRFMNRLRVVTELRNHVFWNRMIHLAHIILTLLYRKNEPDLTTRIRRNRCVRVTN